MTTIIMTAVIAGHYVEMTKPGSFQKIFDKIMEANGLPRVIIPMDEIIKNISSLMEELISTIRNKYPDRNETASNITTMNTEQNMQTDTQTPMQGTKRGRSGDTPTEEPKKKKKRNREKR